MEFSEILRKAREARGITQARLFVDTDISMSMIQKYEAGTAKPGYDHLVTLSEYFGKPLLPEMDSHSTWSDNTMLDLREPEPILALA